jgi:Tfp pilus assembly protein PilF
VQEQLGENSNAFQTYRQAVKKHSDDRN